LWERSKRKKKKKGNERKKRKKGLKKDSPRIIIDAGASVRVQVFASI